MATNNFTAASGEWNTAGNWSLGHVPDNTEDTTFTGIDGSGALTITTTTASAKSVDFSTAGAAFTLSGDAEFRVYGNITIKTGMTWSHSGWFYPSYATNGGVITSNSVSIESSAAIAVAAGTLVLGDAINTGTKNLNVRGGANLTTNNNGITCAALSDGESAGAVTLTLGSSTINCTNISLAATTLTVSANTATINVVPTATVTLNASSTSWGNANFNVGAASKTVNLGAALTHTGTFTHVNGTLDLKGLTLTTGAYASSNTNTRVLQDTTGGGNIIVTGLTGTVFDMSTATNLTVSNAPAIQIGTSALTQTGDVTFAGGGKTFGNFTITKHAGNYSCILTGSNTFATFTCATPDATYQYSGVKFTAGTTTTVTSFVATGTASYTIPITSVTGSTHTLSDSAGTNTANYCTISYSVAQGGASWLTQSCTDGGNNTGWVFGNRRRRLLICGGSR